MPDASETTTRVCFGVGFILWSFFNEYADQSGTIAAKISLSEGAEFCGQDHSLMCALYNSVDVCFIMVFLCSKYFEKLRNFCLRMSKMVGVTENETNAVNDQETTTMFRIKRNTQSRPTNNTSNVRIPRTQSQTQTPVTTKKTSAPRQENTFTKQSTQQSFNQMMGNRVANRYGSDKVQNTIQGVSDTGTLLGQVGGLLPGVPGLASRVLGATMGATGSSMSLGKNIGQGNKLDAVGDTLSTIGSLASIVPGGQGIGLATTGTGFAIRNRKEIAQFGKESIQSVGRMTADDWAHGMPGLPD